MNCAYLKKSLKSVQWFRSYGQNSNGLGRHSVLYEGALFFEKISRNITDTEKMMMTNVIGNFVADNTVFEVSKIGPLDPEIWAKKWSKSSQIEVPERFFEKNSRNMTDIEKMLISVVVNWIVRI